MDTLDDNEFQRIRNACVNRAQGDERLCSSLQCASNSDHLFNTLAPHCNWICIEYLDTIAYTYSRNNCLINLIKDYSRVIFSKPLGEVWNLFPYNCVRDTYYYELTAIFEEKDPDKLTVEELLQKKPQMAKDIAMRITLVRTQSLLVSWLIPTYKVYQAYLSFLTVPKQSRKDRLVKFGNWVAYLPQCVLQEQQKRFG